MGSHGFSTDTDIPLLSGDCCISIKGFSHKNVQIVCTSKANLEMVLKLTDVPKYKSTMGMSTYLCNFESYLSTHYGVEGFPLDYVVWPKLAHLPWHTMSPQNLRHNVYNAFPDFFQVDETHFNS